MPRNYRFVVCRIRTSCFLAFFDCFTAISVDGRSASTVTPESQAHPTIIRLSFTYSDVTNVEQLFEQFVITTSRVKLNFQKSTHDIVKFPPTQR